MSHNGVARARKAFSPRRPFFTPRAPARWDDKSARAFMDEATARYGGGCKHFDGKHFRFTGMFDPDPRVVDVPCSVSPGRAMRALEELLVDMPLAGCPQVWAPGPS